MLKTWTLRTYCPAELPEWVVSNYEGLVPYVKDFLTSKHPHRNGVMCPFVPKAIKDDLIYFTYFDNEAESDEDALIENSVKFFSDYIGSQNGSIIVIFKENFPIERMHDLHIRNKEKCIRSWIMLGLLYRTSSASSLHSEQYFPLRTPTPVAVLRNLTSSDLVFLDPTHYSKKQRVSFLSAFIDRFSIGASAFTARQVEIATKLRNKYRMQIVIKKLTICLMLTVAAIVISLGMK